MQDLTTGFLSRHLLKTTSFMLVSMVFQIIQACFLPVVALGFAVAPVAGQNFGARRAARGARPST